MNTQTDEMRKPFCSECSLENTLISDSNLNEAFISFVRDVLKSYLLKLSAIISEVCVCFYTCAIRYCVTYFFSACIFQVNALLSYLLSIAYFYLYSQIHNNCLRIFILSAFDMAREIQITPRRILYAQTIELQLYDNLMRIASEKQEEITKIIQLTLQTMRNNIGDVLAGYKYNGY